MDTPLRTTWQWLLAPSMVVIMLLAPALAWAQTAPKEELNNLVWPGVRLLKDSIEVFFRTAEPVKWRQGPAREGTITLFLDNTTVTLANNARSLETHYFPGPIERVAITPMEEPNRLVRIDILLKYNATFQQRQQDNVLTLIFAR